MYMGFCSFFWGSLLKYVSSPLWIGGQFIHLPWDEKNPTKSCHKRCTSGEVFSDPNGSTHRPLPPCQLGGGGGGGKGRDPGRHSTLVFSSFTYNSYNFSKSDVSLLDKKYPTHQS